MFRNPTLANANTFEWYLLNLQHVMIFIKVFFFFLRVEAKVYSFIDELKFFS